MIWFKTTIFIALIALVILAQKFCSAWGIGVNLIICSIIIAVFLNHPLKWPYIFVLSLIVDWQSGTYAFYFLSFSASALIIDIILKQFSSSNKIALFFCSVVGLIIYPWFNFLTPWLNHYIFSQTLPVVVSNINFYSFTVYLIVNTVILSIVLPNLKKFMPRDDYV